MESIDSILFEDPVTRDQAWIGLYAEGGLTRLVLSLKSNGDADVHLGPAEMAALRNLLAKAATPADFEVGRIYEDCAFHPVLCTSVDVDADGDISLEGISLIDGSGPRSCSVAHCGPIPMTLAEAFVARGDFARHVARRTAENQAGSS